LEAYNLTTISLFYIVINFIFAAYYQESQVEIATCINKQGAKYDKPIPWKKC